MISLIVAMDKKGLIGKGNMLPWNIREELMFFKRQTMGKFLLMGERTYLSLPAELGGRKIIVLSENKKNLGFKTINNFKYVETHFASGNEEIYIAGGKSVYEQFYKKAQILYISIISKEHKGDVFLDLDLSGYHKTMYKEFQAFKVYKYTRRGEK